jgi:DNA-binding NarL/FixJ family response regulator
VTRWVRTNYPEIATLILTAHDRDVFRSTRLTASLAEMEEAGAAGFLTKDEDTPALVEAIQRAARGEVLYTPEQLERARRWREEVSARWESLTEHEREVALLIAAGKSNKGSAEALTISEHTVETHVGNILRKLDVASRTEAAVWLWEHDSSACPLLNYPGSDVCHKDQGLAP